MTLLRDRVWKLLKRTAPYVIYRAACYGAVAGVICVIVVAPLLAGAIFGVSAFWLLLAAILYAIWATEAWRLARLWLMRMADLGHVALFAELLRSSQLPYGIRQSDWARRQVKETLTSLGGSATMERLVRDALAEIGQQQASEACLFPFETMDTLRRGSRRLLRFAAPRAARAVWARVLNETGRKPANEIVLFARHGRELFPAAVSFTLLSLAAGVGFFILAGIPAALCALFSTCAWVKFFWFCCAVFCGLAAKVVVFDALADAAMTIVFFDTIEDDTPVSESEKAGLAARYPAFTTLCEKGRSYDVEE